MDVALGLQTIRSINPRSIMVLILVVMDVARGQDYLNRDEASLRGLNPCCNGCRTWTW